jgi:hypothetical protein
MQNRQERTQRVQTLATAVEDQTRKTGETTYATGIFVYLLEPISIFY